MGSAVIEGCKNSRGDTVGYRDRAIEPLSRPGFTTRWNGRNGRTRGRDESVPDWLARNKRGGLSDRLARVLVTLERFVFQDSRGLARLGLEW